jgi:hypothetical protein
MFFTSSCFCEEVLFNLIPNEVRETLKVKTVDTHAQREDRGWGTLYTVKNSKTLSQKCNKTQKQGTHEFCHNLKYPLKRI